MVWVPLKTFDRKYEQTLNRFLAVQIHDIGEERADRRQPRIAGSCGIVALPFHIVKKRQDGVGSEVVVSQLRYMPASGFRQMPQKKAKSIAVASDGVRTGIEFSC